MKRYITIALALVALSLSAATKTVDSLVDTIKMEHAGEYLKVDLTLNLSQLKFDDNRAILLTPIMANGSDTLRLDSVAVYSHTRYYQYLRRGKPLAGKYGKNYKKSEVPSKVTLCTLIPFAEWMNGGKVTILRKDYGCCSTILAQAESEPIITFEEEKVPEPKMEFFPELVYIVPKATDHKERAVEGEAKVDFPVNKTTIYTDYHNNYAELGKIRQSIDELRNDADVTLESVWLKGFASPESPYNHNATLAHGRTEAIKQYISNMYSFKSGIISTEFEPENWEGLRAYVEQSSLEHRQEILDIIDLKLDPDVKEKVIKSSYPSEYQFLLKNCYPNLRRTLYRINYSVRTYSDIDEIRRVLKRRPQNLSLNEFYLAAQGYEPGSDEFTEVFETAVKTFPDDEAANLNAANAAMRRGDLTAAERYLKKAGNSAEAVYGRAAYAIKSEDFDTARKLLKEAANMGLRQAKVTLEELDEKLKNKK